MSGLLARVDVKVLDRVFHITFTNAINWSRAMSTWEEFRGKLSYNTMKNDSRKLQESESVDFNLILKQTHAETYQMSIVILPNERDYRSYHTSCDIHVTEDGTDHILNKIRIGVAQVAHDMKERGII